jgi:hypothetical protein
MAHDQEVMGSKPGTVYWMDEAMLAIKYNSYTKIAKLKVAKWGILFV